jgi:hypothetical protein
VPLEAYVSEPSVLPGQPLRFHARNDSAVAVRIQINEVAGEQHMPLFVVESQVGPYTTPARAYEFGCGWPVIYELSIPKEWPSGLYRAHLSTTESSSASSDVFFIVRSLVPGSISPILMQFATTTYQAYNAWGGKSLYPSDSPSRSRRVSFERPGGIDYTREIAFLLWSRRNAIPIECCSNIDLHDDARLLKHYQLLLSVGHDEYWSKEMRDNVEHFIEAGGNVAFFSGNTCWWQIRFEEPRRTMVCYRSALEDPVSGVDNSRVTVNWYAAPVGRPENYLTGVSFRNGAGIWQPCASSMKLKSFTVRQSEHWVFDDTGLRDGDQFGVGESIVGYETDATDYYLDVHGCVHLSGADGTPPDFVVLATADLNDWGPCGKAGGATMGMFRRTGTVFTAATTDWVRGLFAKSSVVPRITLNVIRKLRHRYPADQWEPIGDGRGIIALCAIEGKLFASNESQQLLWRGLCGQNRRWEILGECSEALAMAAAPDQNCPSGRGVYVLARSGTLLRRDAVILNSPWQPIGEFADGVGLAAADNYLYAISAPGRLFRSKIVDPLAWQPVDSLGNATAMTSSSAELFVLCDDKLTWRSAAFDVESKDLEWIAIGRLPAGVTCLAASDHKLICVSEGRLLWRDAMISKDA